MDELSPLDRCEPIRVLFIAFCVAVTAVAFYPVAARGDTASSAGKWYRLTVDAVRSGAEVQFSEFYLYDGAEGTPDSCDGTHVLRAGQAASQGFDDYFRSRPQG